MATTPSLPRPISLAEPIRAMGSAEFVTADVIRYLAKWISVPESKITSQTRLVQDLGMTSEEALDFFEAFGKNYGVNLDSLFARHWQRHFGGLGMTLDSLCTLFLCAAPAGFLAGFGAGFDIWLLYISSVLLWLVGFHGWPFFRRQPQGVPIRARDLAVSVRLGRWYEAPSGKSRPVVLKRRPHWAVPAART